MCAYFLRKSRIFFKEKYLNKLYDDRVQHSGIDAANDVVENSSSAVFDLFIKIRRRPNFDDVKNAKHGKEDKQICDVVFSNEEPSDTHTDDFINDNPLWIVQGELFLNSVSNKT